MIDLTPEAIAKVREILKEENNPKAALRLYVQGGGCSGFQYGFAVETDKSEDDHTFMFEDVAVLVDPMSFMYVENIAIDYKKSLMGDSFTIKNPQAKTQCGCGSSFSC